MSMSDPEGGSIQTVITSLPSKGTLYQTVDGVNKGAQIDTVPMAVSHAQGQLLYEPNPDAFGAGLDAFTFKTNDGIYYSDEATATIDVTGVQDVPGCHITMQNPFSMGIGKAVQNLTGD